LKRPGSAEQKLLDEAVDDSIREFDAIIEGELMVVMNRLHSRKLPEGKSAAPPKTTLASLAAD